ncbi:MAG: glycine dehydrogenase subunit 2 [Spartobacteria bacterium]|nr:glycine dehydrogenase subunit 2 [Spartobacteria bacterium]
MKTIFDKSIAGCTSCQVFDERFTEAPHIETRLLRKAPAALPELPEGEVVRHFTQLSRQNYSVDTHFYPLGSCTMKYNPKACEVAAALDGFTRVHPVWPQFLGGDLLTQGSLEVLYEAERMLSAVTGMAETTLQPMAGAHGELTGTMIMAAYHRDRGNEKDHIIIPDSAHGTNPASAALAGYKIVTIPSDDNGMMDFDAFCAAVNEKTAGVMLTSPNTVGVFNHRIAEIAEVIHGVDGLMYYDGANMNAILGRCKPGSMGFDICHLNLHKTFATPHGGGGPGSGPVGVVEKLRAFLPVSRVEKRDDGTYRLWYDEPKSIGYIAPFYGNFGVIIKAYAYLLMLGRTGLRDVSDMAVLNANYMQHRLSPVYKAVAKKYCMHECVFSGAPFKEYGVHTLDIAKGLIDRGYHPPTIYFPLNVEEAIMIEPTETESRETLDAFCDAMLEIAEVAKNNPESLHAAPISTPVSRLNEVAAARNMVLTVPDRHTNA